MHMTIPPTRYRVEEQTSADINQEIHEAAESRLAYYRNHPEAIDVRLEQLDREWDIERAIEMNAASLALSGVLLGATVSRKWLVLPAAVTGFLLMHAVQGWCPPVPMFRRMGFRTAREIEEERYRLLEIRNAASDETPLRRA